MMENTDEELTTLIKDCRSGNQYALEALYRKVSPPLKNLALSIVRCEALSNEVVQDSFIQIWEHSSSYCEQRGRPLTWMCAIVRNRSIDKLRVEKKHLRRYDCETDQIDIDELPGKSQPAREASREQSDAILNRCIAALAPNERHSIKLAYLQGYSCHDLAEILDANVNTVKSWLHRGSKNLKRYLEPNSEMMEWCD